MSTMKAFANNYFNVDQITYVFKWIENIVGGENPGYHDFFFHSVLKRPLSGLWNKGYLLTIQSRPLTTLWKKPLENIVRKGDKRTMMVLNRSPEMQLSCHCYGHLFYAGMF